MPTAPARPCADPTCGQLTTRGRCDSHRRQITQNRGSSTAQGYGASWRRLRLSVLQEEPLCRSCLSAGRTVAATDVDHIIPRAQGGTDDTENLQPLCHACHSAKTAGEDSATYQPSGQFMVPVTAVCGPPGSGKTAYVTDRAKWGDLIIDLDTLWVALSGQPIYDKPSPLLPLVLATRRALLAQLRTPQPGVRHAWLIISGALASERQALATDGATVVLLDVPPAECIRRIANDPRRAIRWRQWEPIVQAWWARYREGACKSPQP